MSPEPFALWYIIPIVLIVAAGRYAAAINASEVMTAFAFATAVPIDVRCNITILPL